MTELLTDRLVLYFIGTLSAIAIIVGLLFMIQHTAMTNNQAEILHTLNNTETNQQLLKSILEEIEHHEDLERKIFENNTETNINISGTNSERLQKIMQALNITVF